MKGTAFIADDVSLARNGQRFAFFGGSRRERDAISQPVLVLPAPAILRFWYVALSEHASCHEDTALIWADPNPDASSFA